MRTQLQQIINHLKSEGKDYTNFKALLTAIKASGIDISKDEILAFVADDYRIQLHTTPNSIAKLISHLAQANQPKSAIDICCGTGNILYYLQNEIDDLTGVEIVENVSELTKYFIPDLHIITADSFKYSFSQKYDVVVGNIPFGLRIELDGRRMPGEEAFLRKAYELLTDNGSAIMLVPYSVLLNAQFQNFRNDFIDYLQQIIALPSGSIRNTQIKTAILVFGKKSSKNVKLTQLQDFENLDKEYANSISVRYSKAKLTERWDPEYHLTKKSSFYKDLENFETKELQDLAKIVKGKMIPADTLKEQGDYLYLKPVHIQKNGLNIDSALKYVSKDSLSDSDFMSILLPGDIVISTIFSNLKMYVYQNGDVPAFASNNLAIIRSSKQDYILSYLLTDEGKRIFKTQAEDLRKGVAIPHLSIKDLASIKIPVLPIADLNVLGDASISHSTEAQLGIALEQLSEYKIQVQKLEKELENHSVLMAFIENRFNRVESQLALVNKKLDDLLSILKELKTDFMQIQNLPREEEEKLFKLCQKIDSRLDSVYNNEQQTIKGYIEEIKRWLDLWEILDLQSQKFLPIAEFIFDELCKLEDADFAPFVVQYCRTLENEILKKLFEAYHRNGLQGINREELVQYDLVNLKTKTFANMVRKDKQSYTLGEMNFIMALLKHGGNTLNESPLLQHFRAFTISYFDEKIVEAEFLKDVNKLTNDFRNKAAHPYSISIGLAKECQSLLRKSLNVFLESVKTNNK
ncbi:MAG: N-6 DNA methylase [Saprospiraceae bacterium]|nr:N-6 DNA methylase [Saprospiraceae bacterium]MBK9630993.1 N-6 DNA methylase [Saprospiraceae bacterium]